MMGIIRWNLAQSGKREKGVIIKEERIAQMRLLQAEISRSPKTTEMILRRRVTAAAKRLQKRGITRVILPVDFAYEEQIQKRNLIPVSTIPLRQVIAADWVRWLLEKRGIPAGEACVAVGAEKLTGEVVRTVTKLALRHRYVLLDVPRGGELSRQLRREYGVSLLLESLRKEMNGVDVFLFFQPQTGFGTGLCLVDESVPLPPLHLGLDLEKSLSADVDRGQMLSALLQAGTLRSDEIVVGGTNSTESEAFLTKSPP